MAYRTKICDNGGIFNVSRPSAYSAETRTFINDLIKESRLTTLQRKSLQGWLRSGGDPPSVGAATAAPRREPAAGPVVERYRPRRPRTLRDIVESGAYEPDAYRPDRNSKNYDVEKEKLQSIMAFGRVTKLDPVNVHKKSVSKKLSQECTDEELIDSAMAEIEDREKFLADMETLGQASKYGTCIIDEIRDRIKKIESFVSKTSCNYRLTDVRDVASKYRKPMGSPRAVPRCRRGPTE